MANDYTHFCEGLRLDTPKEHTWVRANTDWDLFVDDEDDPTGLTPPEWFDEEGECLKFSYTLEKSEIIFYSEENDDPAAVAEFVHAFLKAFDRPDRWRLAYAYTCDRHLPGHFGGGAYFVTKEEIRELHTSQWLSEQARENASP